MFLLPSLFPYSPKNDECLVQRLGVVLSRNQVDVYYLLLIARVLLLAMPSGQSQVVQVRFHRREVALSRMRQS